MRSGRRTRRRRNVRRVAFGNFASAMQQRDSTNIVVSSTENVVLAIPAGADEGTVVRNVTSLLCGTKYFENYCGMYDQFKINAVRASIEMTAIDGQLMSVTNFPSICTCWDRNGINLRTVQVNQVNHYMLPGYDAVTSYSSANEKTLYYGSRWSITRQLDASSLMEKSMYIGTTNTRDVMTYDTIRSQWNPCLLISLKSANVIAGAMRTATFTIHWQWDITLRGLRKVFNAVNIVPGPTFIGYATNNYGLAVNDQNGNPVVVNNLVNGPPTINPLGRLDQNGQYVANPHQDYANNGLAANNILP